MASLSCEALALQLLAAREHSQHELMQKLKRRGFSSPEIAAVLQQLAARDWQSDQRFAESYLRSRAGRGYGPLRIEQELQQRGITSEIIANAFADSDINWSAACQKVRQKKFASGEALDAAGRAKQQRFLYYRGFTAEQIQAVEFES